MKLQVRSFTEQIYSRPHHLITSHPLSFHRTKPHTLSLSTSPFMVTTRSRYTMSSLFERRGHEDGASFKDVESPRNVISPSTNTKEPSSTSPLLAASKPKLISKDHFHIRLGSWQSSQIPLRPELIAISLVYLVQGLLGLSRLAIFTFFKDDLQLNPATVGILTSLGMAPWFIKPVYGFLTDTVPLFGYRRRSYLIACGILGAGAWTLMSTVADSPTNAVVFLFMSSLSTACADVVADSIVVELSRGEPQSTAGSLQSLCWASAAVGGILSSYYSGALVQNYGSRPVFLLTAAFPVFVAAAAALIPEERIVVLGGDSAMHDGSSSVYSPSNPPSFADGTTNFSKNSLKSQLYSQSQELWKALSQRSIFLPALFVFLWQATPSPDTAMLFFETNKLGFSTELLGRIRLVASVASFAGVGVYNFYLKKTPLRKMFLWSAILGTGLGMTQLILITGLNRQWGIGDELFALGDSALLTVLGQVSFMPVLVLAARICPEGVEATLFATLMSILNGGSFVGSALGSTLTSFFGVTSTNFDNLAPLMLVCTLSTLMPLPLLSLLPEHVDEEVSGGKEKD